MTPQRSIIVTGGASGIGLGITRHFATQPNTHITILDINNGTAVLAQLRAEFPSASLSFEQCDVSSWESQAAAFEKVHAEQGHVDIVFANAGITETGNLLAGIHDEKPAKPGLATLNVNLVGVIYTVNLAAHYVAKNTPRPGGSSPAVASRGSIICTASNAGIYPFPIAPVYAATKSGVIGLVRALARPLGEEQIQINALAPAIIETNIAPDPALFRSMILTPMETATKAVARLVNDASLTGKVAELHGENVTFAEPPAYVDEDSGTNIEMCWKLGHA
ncbi:putative short chain dehydrogenase/reductase [Aspergillus clavatus NRRL 1]|uniref:Short chain dehydrogenase/reductase, putative n=1 Tax=Aspergillus clavatus (strain ATCC 1007 / CBS 513.65 / DSM 816 / NCTC 3887 / NRRL 1 / QM 1276 / 107) TaxID=344612 RepID=A1CML7_ASPCL|nr:short chain dehydrogenase/reductase, putative [Aspergillus clavatus NRRL 1]EAW08804.1 short chain dehydrogenase/reductase, putative [Aspergillus clavatus NRRL 1]